MTAAAGLPRAAPGNRGGPRASPCVGERPEPGPAAPGPWEPAPARSCATWAWLHLVSVPEDMGSGAQSQRNMRLCLPERAAPWWGEQRPVSGPQGARVGEQRPSVQPPGLPGTAQLGHWRDCGPVGQDGRGLQRGPCPSRRHCACVVPAQPVSPFAVSSSHLEKTKRTGTVLVPRLGRLTHLPSPAWPPPRSPHPVTAAALPHELSSSPHARPARKQVHREAGQRELQSSRR